MLKGLIMWQSVCLRILFYKLLIIVTTPVLSQPIYDKRCALDIEAALLLQQNNPDEKGIKKSYDALFCLANKGDNYAKNELFLIFYRTYPVLEQKAEEALLMLVEAARSGIVDAQYTMGYLYFEGEVVVKDEDLGFEWWKAASEHGSSDAAFELSVKYLRMEKVKLEQEKFDEAQKLYDQFIYYSELAVKRGHIEASRLLGVSLISRADSEEKLQRGISLVKEAAEGGNVESMFNLGEIYEFKSEISKDDTFRKVAIEWYKKAANLGNEEAKEKIKEKL
jgi:hypothetical protein